MNLGAVDERCVPVLIERMPNVIVLIGAGQIGQAIARRVGVGKHVVLADMRPENAAAAAEGSDFLMDGGVTAAYWYGELAPGDRA